MGRVALPDVLDRVDEEVRVAAGFLKLAGLKPKVIAAVERPKALTSMSRGGLSMSAGAPR